MLDSAQNMILACFLSLKTCWASFSLFLSDFSRKLHGNIECFNVYHGEHKNVLVCKNKPKKTQKHKKINPHLRKTKEMMKECSEDDEKKQKRDDAHNFATDWAISKIPTRIISLSINLLIYIKTLSYFSFS